MTSALATQAKYPFGLRDGKIYPFLDQNGTALAELGFDLPAIQTFSFADNESYVDLRGDDILQATHGSGAQVNWTLEAGGISLQVWAILTGGQIIEAGVAPNRTITLRKCSDDIRPYFQVRGLAVNDNAGDTVAVVYRAKCNGDISGQFGDGVFFVTSADGIGLPLPGTKLLYDFIQHESRTFLALESEPIPLVPPKNLLAVPLSPTAAKAIWEPVSGYTGYLVQVSNDDGSTWTVLTGGTNEGQTITIGGTATSGTFTLTFDGQTTTALQWNSTAAQVKAALEALSNIEIGDITATGGPLPGSPIVATFGGSLAGTNVPQMTATSSLVGSSPTIAVTTTTGGVAGAGSVTDPEIDLTGLVAATDYVIRVAGKIGTDLGYFSPGVAFTTLAS